MNTFFYSIKRSTCGSDCHWRICSQGYFAKLKKLNGLENIYPIFGEKSYLSLPPKSSPRNGDIVILYAEDTRQIDAMIALREDFDGLKKLLVVADAEGVGGDKYHLLAPRYITQSQRDINELKAVILKMKSQSH